MSLTPDQQALLDIYQDAAASLDVLYLQRCTIEARTSTSTPSGDMRTMWTVTGENVPCEVWETLGFQEAQFADRLGVTRPVQVACPPATAVTDRSRVTIEGRHLDVKAVQRDPMQVLLLCEETR